jgi:prepilin peptidase CpaA
LVKALWILADGFALAAGFTDLRWRKIPNWLTYPAVPVAIALHWIIAGSHAALRSLAGAALGMAILLPFVLLRMLGGGDWKLVTALGAFFGRQRLIPVLFLTLIVAAVMALALVLWQRRLGHTLRNIGRLIATIFSLHFPTAELTIDDPKAAKIPFGIAAAIAVVLYVVSQPWVAF